MNFEKSMLRLYAVTDRTWLNGRTLETVVEEALQAGVTMVQLREKSLPKEELLQEALRLKEVCHRYHVPLLIDDDVEICALADADDDAGNGVDAHQQHDYAAVPPGNAGQEHYCSEYSAEQCSGRASVHRSSNDDWRESQRYRERAEAHEVAENLQYDDDGCEQGKTGLSPEPFAGCCVTHIKFLPAVAPLKADAAQLDYIHGCLFCQLIH